MRTIVNYTISPESIEAQTKARRYNPTTVCTFRDKRGKHTVTIGKGNNDYIDVFREGHLTFILTRNFSFGYVGLDVFDGDENIGNMFLQSTEQVDELLGQNGIDKAGWWISKVLANYAIQ